MASLASDEISLAGLPSDIVRMIAKMQLDSIDDMRVISRRWNNAAISLLNDHKLLPAIKRFACENADGSSANIIVTISQCKKKFFRFENWYCFSEVGTYGASNDLSEREPLSMLFGRCSLIEQIEICEYAFERILDIKDSLQNITMNEIFIHGVQFNARLMQSLREFIETHSIKKLKFTTRCENSTSWDAVRQDLIELLNTCATQRPAVELTFLRSAEERLNNTAMMRDIWQTRVDDLNQRGNISMTMNFSNVQVVIHVNPKLSK